MALDSLNNIALKDQISLSSFGMELLCQPVRVLGSACSSHWPAQVASPSFWSKNLSRSPRWAGGTGRDLLTPQPSADECPRQTALHEV